MISHTHVSSCHISDYMIDASVYQETFSVQGSRTFFICIFALIETAFLSVYAITQNVLFVLVPIGILVVFAWIAFSIERTLLLLIVYICVLPSYAWGAQYSFFKLYASIEIIAGLVLLCLFILFTKCLLGFHQKNRYSVLDVSILAFLLWVSFSSVVGYFNHGNGQLILLECFFLFLYATYFLVINNRIDEKWIYRLWNVFSIVTIVVSIEYMLLALSEAGSGNIFIMRVTTQQPHLALLGVPLFVGFFVMPSGASKKIVSFFALVCLSIMIFLSQQRGLWVGVTVTFFMFVTLSFFRGRVSPAKIFKFMAVLLLTVILIFSSLAVTEHIFKGSILLTLLPRIESFEDLSRDKSLEIRMSEIDHALDQWKESIITGTGLGSTYEQRNVDRPYTYHTDNSYAYLLWKTGIIGLLLYMTILFLFFKRALYIVRNTENTQQQRITIALAAGFTGLMVVALTNSCIVLYRFNIIWAMIFATIEIFYRQTRELKIERVSNVPMSGMKNETSMH